MNVHALIIIVIIIIVVSMIILIIVNNKYKVAIISNSSIRSRNLTIDSSRLSNIEELFYNLDIGIKYYILTHPEFRSRVIWFYSNGTSSNAYEIIKKCYNNGFKNIIGPYTTDELQGDVLNFVKDHPDITLYTGSCTSTDLEYVKNIKYFIVLNTLMGSVISTQIINNTDMLNVLILYRNDTWGMDYNNFITEYIASNNITRTITHYPYDYTLPSGFLDVPVNNMKTLLSTLDKTKTCVVFVGFDEFTDYITKVENDSDFFVWHLGTDAQAHVNSYLEPQYADFLTNNDFSSVSYNGSNRYVSSDAVTTMSRIYSRYSNHSLIYYDITDCMFNKNIDLSKYYGLSGSYIMKDNRRQYGECDIFRINHQIDNTYSWYVSHISSSPNLSSDYKNTRNLSRDNPTDPPSPTISPNSVSINTIVKHDNIFNERIIYYIGDIGNPIIIDTIQYFQYDYYQSITVHVEISRENIGVYAYTENTFYISYNEDKTKYIISFDNNKYVIDAGKINDINIIFSISGTIYIPTINIKINNGISDIVSENMYLSSTLLWFPKKDTYSAIVKNYYHSIISYLSTDEYVYLYYDDTPEHAPMWEPLQPGKTFQLPYDNIYISLKNNPTGGLYSGLIFINP